MSMDVSYLEIKDFFRVMAVGSHKGFQCLHVCFWIPKITFEDEMIYRYFTKREIHIGLVNEVKNPIKCDVVSTAVLQSVK